MDCGRTAGAPGAVPAAALERSSSPPLGRTDPALRGALLAGSGQRRSVGDSSGCRTHRRGAGDAGVRPRRLHGGDRAAPGAPPPLRALRPSRRKRDGDRRLQHGRPPRRAQHRLRHAVRGRALDFTVRARRHLFLADFTSGRLVEAQVATTAQQWDAHRDAVVQAETTETDQAAPPRARRPRAWRTSALSRRRATARSSRTPCGKGTSSPPTIRAGSGSRQQGRAGSWRGPSRGRRRRPRCRVTSPTCASPSRSRSVATARACGYRSSPGHRRRSASSCCRRSPSSARCCSSPAGPGSRC